VTVGVTLSQRSPQQTRFRPDIEGLRAVAVLAVVLFHAEMPGVGGGFVGVDVFFVISGFLITGLLWREVSSTGTVRMPRFYGARARRLLPASAAVGIAIMLGTAFTAPPLWARRNILDGIASALYVSNYRFAWQGIDYFVARTPPSPFQHYWSLGVEEQFYLLWPAVIIGTAWIVRRSRRAPASQSPSRPRPFVVVLGIVAVVSLALSVITTRIAPPIAFFSLPTRAWELAVGGLVALTADRWRRMPSMLANLAGWAGLGMVLLACTQLGPGTPYPGTAALLTVLGAALLIGAGCANPARGCGRILSARQMQAIGRVSYSWYLWHWPLLLAVPASAQGPALGQTVAAVVGSLLLAFLTTRFIENPLRFATAVRQSPHRSLAIGAAATSLAVGVGSALLVAVPTPIGHGPAAPRLAFAAAPASGNSGPDAVDAVVRKAFTEVQSVIAESAGIKAVPSNLEPPLADARTKPLDSAKGCRLGWFEIDHPECAEGDPASSTTIALLGDSNAAMWNPAFLRVAAQRHWRLEILAKGNCPPLETKMIHPVLHREFTECEQWRSQILTRLQGEHPRLVVLAMTRRYGARYGWASGVAAYDDAWNEGLRREVRQLRDTGAQVLVLGPIPDPQSVPPDCLSVHLDDATACSPPRSVAVSQSGIVAESAATEAGGGLYTDLTDLFCTADRCPVIIGNTLVYFDASHVTSKYAEALSPIIGAVTERALARP